MFLKRDHRTIRKRMFSRCQVQCNTALSFSAEIEKAKINLFYYLSPNLSRYLNEFGFIGKQLVPKEKITKSGIKKIQIKPFPVFDMLVLLIMCFAGSHLRRTKQWGILEHRFTQLLFNHRFSRLIR